MGSKKKINLNTIQPDNVRVMKVATKLMQLLLLFPREGHNVTYCFILMHEVFVTLTAVAPAIAGLAYMYQVSRAKNTIEHPVGVVEIIYLYLLRLAFCVRRSTMIETLSKVAYYKYGIPKGLKKIRRRQELISVLIIVGNFSRTMLLSVQNYFNNDYCNSRSVTGDERYVCGLLFPQWYPFDVPDFSVQKLFIYSQTTCVFCVFMTTGTTAVQIVWNLVELICVRIDHLNYLLRKAFAEDDRDVNKLKKNFRKCIKYHEEILELVNCFNEGVKYCCVMQYTMTALLFGIMGYAMLQELRISDVLHLSVWVASEFAICFSGQYLEDKGKTIFDTLCEVDWYKLDKSLTKTYILFMMRTRTTLCFKAPPFAVMNYAFFVSICKTAYSILTCIQSV